MFIKENQLLPHCSRLHPWPQLHTLVLQDSRVSPKRAGVYFLPLDFDFGHVTCLGRVDIVSNWARPLALCRHQDKDMPRLARCLRKRTRGLWSAKLPR